MSQIKMYTSRHGWSFVIGDGIENEDELRKTIRDLHANLEAWQDSSRTKAEEDENTIQQLNGKIRDLKNQLDHCNRAYATERQKAKQNVKMEEYNRMAAELKRLEYDFMRMKSDCQERLSKAKTENTKLQALVDSLK